MSKRAMKIVIGAALTLALATPAAADMRTYGSDDAFRQGWESGERRDAQQFLASMPSVETLMPVLDVATLGPLAPLAIPRHEEGGVGALRNISAPRRAEVEAEIDAPEAGQDDLDLTAETPQPKDYDGVYLKAAPYCYRCHKVTPGIYGNRCGDCGERKAIIPGVTT